MSERPAQPPAGQGPGRPMPPGQGPRLPMHPSGQPPRPLQPPYYPVPGGYPPRPTSGYPPPGYPQAGYPGYGPWAPPGYPMGWRKPPPAPPSPRKRRVMATLLVVVVLVLYASVRLPLFYPTGQPLSSGEMLWQYALHLGGPFPAGFFSLAFWIHVAVLIVALVGAAGYVNRITAITAACVAGAGSLLSVFSLLFVLAAWTDPRISAGPQVPLSLLGLVTFMVLAFVPSLRAAWMMTAADPDEPKAGTSTGSDSRGQAGQTGQQGQSGQSGPEQQPHHQQPRHQGSSN